MCIRNQSYVDVDIIILGQLYRCINEERELLERSPFVFGNSFGAVSFGFRLYQQQLLVQLSTSLDCISVSAFVVRICLQLWSTAFVIQVLLTAIWANWTKVTR